MRFDAEEKSTPKAFVKLGDGQTVTGVFRGEIKTFYQAYIDGKYKIVPKDDPNGFFRFNVNLIVKEGGNLLAKVFQGNWHDYKALKALNEEFTLEHIFVKITQTGERQTKRLAFMPISKQKPDQAQLSEVVLAPLQGEVKRDEEFESISADDEIPF